MSVLQKLTEGIVDRDLQKEGAALLSKWEATGLLEGLDNISLSLQHTDQISAWEKAHGLPPAVSG